VVCPISFEADQNLLDLEQEAKFSSEMSFFMLSKTFCFGPIVFGQDQKLTNVQKVFRPALNSFRPTEGQKKD
jgi:hypothetical protein